MIYHLADLLDPAGQTWMRLAHRYVSSRAAFAFLVALVLVLVLMPRAIRLFVRLGWVDRPRAYLGDLSSKRGVPVMGGTLICLASFSAMLLWCDLADRCVQLVLLSGGWLFLLGLADDLLKIKSGKSDGGLSRGAKYAAQVGLGLVLALVLVSPLSPHPEPLRAALHVPMVKMPIPIGLLQVPFVVLAVVLIVNAINFADGMDGLATGPSILTFLGLGVFAYVMGHRIWAEHFLFFPTAAGGFAFVPSSELVVVASAMVGALMGFLWYNAYPAHVFMGDCGSMFLGGVLAALFVLLKQELLFPLFGLVFLLEALSVMLQDWIGIQLLGRRIMFRAPLHENLKYLGWSEPKIVVRLWILSVAGLALGLLTIKLR